MQYQGFSNQINIGSPSPQDQILADVHQHRFFVGSQRQRPQPQANGFQPQPQSNGFQGFHAPDNFPYHNFQNPYQPERKPVLLQPTYSDDYKPQRQPQDQNFQPQLNYQPQNSFQPSFPPPQEPIQYQQAQPTFPQPQQASVPTYQQSFQGFDNNYVIAEKPKKHQQYLTETVVPKQPEYSATYRPDLKQETPSWVLETQPATSYRKQKPIEAITFATEAYKSSTQAPRVVKYRPRPKQEEKEAPVKDQSGEIFIKTDRKKLYEQLIQSEKKASLSVTPRNTTPKPVRSTTATYATTSAPQPHDEKYIQEQLQKQIQEQLNGKDDIFQTLKITLPGDLSPDQIANLPNLALGDSVAQLPEYSGGLSSFPGFPASKDGGLPESVFLANGQKLKISTSPAKSQKNKNVKTVIVQQTASTTTAKPSQVYFEELTKGVLPPGADFELIRQGQDGGLENVGPIQNLPQKKVTFVILEEQPDGSVKVQGVRGSENEQTDTKGAEVDSIIEKLKKGEIKLPPSTKTSKPNKHQTQQHHTAVSVTPSESQASHNYVKHEGKVSEKATPAPKRRTTTTSPVYVHSTPSVSLNSHSGPVFQEDFVKVTTASTPRAPQYSTPQYNSPSSSPPKFLPTLTPHRDNSVNYSPSSTYTPSYPSQVSSTSSPIASTPVPDDAYSFTPQSQSTSYPNEDYYSYQTSSQPTSIGSSSPVAVLGDTLKTNGLYAMARYLRQSGLDMVLNETGM